MDLHGMLLGFRCLFFPLFTLGNLLLCHWNLVSSETCALSRFYADTKKHYLTLPRLVSRRRRLLSSQQHVIIQIASQFDRQCKEDRAEPPDTTRLPHFVKTAEDTWPLSFYNSELLLCIFAGQSNTAGTDWATDRQILLSRDLYVKACKIDELTGLSITSS
jgi:hypothetical protein